MTELAAPSTPLPHWTAAELAQSTGGTWHPVASEKSDISVARIISNTRLIQSNDAFLALIGERFDAHNYVADAAKQGAVVAIVSRLIADVSIPQLLVDDTRLALGRLATARRQSFPQLETVALTGSSGKTTTKEMIGSILRSHSSDAEVLVTRGNLNNDLGVPMMLLELTPQHRFAVMELGANHIGEIAYTTAMVKPKVAGVLNIGTAHVGEFGGREGIARAKSEIFQGLAADGIAIIPAQGDFSEVIAQAARNFQTIRFGGDQNNSDVFATHIEILPTSSQFTLNAKRDTISVDLPFSGAHNIENALAAAAFALALDIPLTTTALGLSQALGAKGRLNFLKHNLPNGTLTLIDDTYNANPHSIRAAAQVLTAQAGSRVLVLGDIGELGESAADEHRLLGVDLAKMPLHAIFAVGKFAPSTIADIALNTVEAQAFDTKDQLLIALKNWLQSHTHQSPYQMNILFKGSRFTQMETLINTIETEIQKDAQAFEHTIFKNAIFNTTKDSVSETR
ncbi:MAG: UDP-N-acetylmuramoyl-tripeptide--D-alanyl-D-alanine ligase [Candidatus Saccharibacteria bacterium]|nr:UDP-N-acetylmuramoyl-tripeptide--D-alanyl-D-alanine ligase [Moraxellaceae bacterium]